MGQNESISAKGVRGLSGHWQPLKKGTIRHSVSGVELYEQYGKKVAEVRLPIQCKNVEQAAEYYRYYQMRGKMQSHSNLIKLAHADLVDIRGQSMDKYLEQTHHSIKTRVDTMCTLNIFQANCRRFAGQERTDFKGEMRLCVEYCSSNLEQQSERRRCRDDHYSEKELWDLLQEATAVANILSSAGMKEPALSPLAIKITPDGKYRIGEWQFVHFFQQTDVVQEQTNFHQEGETFLHHGEKYQQEHKDEKSGRQFDLLTHYYWPPEGTTGVQSMMGLGKLSTQGHSKGKGQVFSLAMTLLQLILERPLYQRQTFSEKKLTKFLQQIASFRNSKGLSLSVRLTSLLGKMLAWDPQDRLDFHQLQFQLGQGSASLSSLDEELISSNKLTTSKSYIFSREVDDSGRVKQGSGDEAHPIAEQMVAETNRSVIQDCSVNYHKLDYTIHRQRREWERFENRLNQTSYHLLPGIELIKHSAHIFPAEVMLGDCEDQPNQEQLINFPVNNELEKEEPDEEQDGGPEHSRKSDDQRVQESIKLMDVSNRRATQQTQQTLKSGRRALLEMANPPSINNNFSTVQQIRKFTPKGAFSSEESLLLKSSKSPQVAHFKQNSVEHISVSQDEELFTSPELMALIRSSVRRHEKQSSDNNIKLQLSPSCVRSGPGTDLSKSSFVKEQFAKGWYQGGKNGGMRSGYGTFHYNQGGKYCGDWQDNQMHGRGTLYYADGRIAYQGDWRQDALHGQGILYNQNPKKLQQLLDYNNLDQLEQFWIYYEGEFIEDDKCGRGALQLSNGERFQGQFRGDVVQGRGAFFTLDGRIISGEWSNNKLIRIFNIQQRKVSKD